LKHRVLQLIGSYHQGGSERQAISLITALKNEGSFDVFAGTLNDEGILKQQVESLGFQNIPVFPLNSFYDLNFMQQVRSCARYLKANKIDVIHTHDFYTNVFGMAAATLARTPVAIASKRETAGMRSPSQEKLERFAFKRADALVVNSGSVKEYLDDGSILTEKIRVIYNGIDTSIFEQRQDDTTIRQKLGLPLGNGIRLITIVANLRHEVKNIPMLLRAAAEVLKSVKSTAFVIAGEGALKGVLEDYAAELGVADNVHFIGRCLDVPALLASSYVGVLTSTAEGFSNALIEYMAAGLPVVATSVGGAAEAVVDGETGYLIDSDDDHALAAKLIMLLQDKGLSEMMGASGRRTVEERFSAAAQLEKTISLYREMLR
jgi:L-malate glycosyltransferase